MALLDRNRRRISAGPHGCGPAVRARLAILAAVGCLVASGCGEAGSGPNPSVAVTLAASEVTLQAGDSMASVVTIDRSAEGAEVTLSVHGAPPGVTATFDPNPTTGHTSRLVLRVAAATPPGEYALAVHWKSTGGSGERALHLTVAPGTVEVSISPAALVIAQGSSDHVLLRTVGTSTLALTGVPAGVTAAFNRIGLQFLAVRVAPTAPPGLYEVMVHAAGPGGRDSVVLPLTVVANPAGFGISIPGLMVRLYNGTRVSINVSIVRGTESGQIAFSVSDLPAGTTATFTPSVTTGDATTLQLLGATSRPSIPLFLRIVGTGTAGSSTAEVMVYTPRGPAP